MNKNGNPQTLKPRKKGDPPLPGGGRPIGSISFKNRLEKILNTKIAFGDKITGKKHKKFPSDVICEILVKKALQGEDRSIKEIMDRVDGEPDKCFSLDLSKIDDETLMKLAGEW